MAKFGAASLARLANVDVRLRTLFESVVEQYDCAIPQDGGARTLVRQAELVKAGVSKTMESLHVIDLEHLLARAVDVVPYPVVWPTQLMSRVEYAHAIGRFYEFAGLVRETARVMKLPVRWGGDWDNDHDFSDQRFDDLDHWELLT